MMAYELAKVRLVHEFGHLSMLECLFGNWKGLNKNTKFEKWVWVKLKVRFLWEIIYFTWVWFDLNILFLYLY